MNALEQKRLNASLAQVVVTASGDLVEGLYYEFGASGEPSRIRGVVLEPGPNGMRRQPTSWLPTGRHRLYESLNLSVPPLS
jgi:hypothetical protein